MTDIWDDWENAAIAAGMDDELAALGRQVMRESHERSWPAPIAKETDAGPMLKSALKDADQARARWEHLLETDGEKIRVLDDLTIVDYETGIPV